MGTLARCPGCSRIPERRDGGSRIWAGVVPRNGRGLRNNYGKAAPFVYHDTCTQHRAHRNSTRRPGLAANSEGGGWTRRSLTTYGSARTGQVEIPAFGGSERLEPSEKAAARRKGAISRAFGSDGGRATGAASGRDGQRRQIVRHDRGPTLNKREATIRQGVGGSECAEMAWDTLAYVG